MRRKQDESSRTCLTPPPPDPRHRCAKPSKPLRIPIRVGLPSGSFDTASRPPNARPPPARWSLEAVAGSLVELSARGASASLSFAFCLVHDAQQCGEPVAWLTPHEHVFFPPDAAAGGTDLEALVVVRLADARRLARAAEQLARSGAFGLLLLDLGHTRVPQAMLTRLTGLAQKHGTAVVFLTAKDANTPSLGSLISLRGEVQRKRSAEGRFRCELHAIKDKRRGPGWRHSESFDGPAGLR